MLTWILLGSVGWWLVAALKRMPLGPANRWIASLAICVCGAQLAVEGPRVQLVPAYVVAAAAFCGFVLSLLKQRFHSPQTAPHARSIIASITVWIGFSGGVLLLLSSIALCLSFPRFEYPKPSGPLDVGTRTFRLIDVSRLETNTPDPDDYREILVRVSYPASLHRAQELVRDTVPDLGTVALSEFWAGAFEMPWARIPTNAAVAAPLADTQTKYPVLIYSHGLGGWPEQNTALIEELVSHGYIVMAINHPFLGAAFTFSDGSVRNMGIVRMMSEFPPTAEQAKRSREVQAQIDQEQARIARDSSASGAKLASLLKERQAVRADANESTDQRHRLAADDQRFLLDSLEGLQSSDAVLRDRMDLERLGVFGYSLGAPRRALRARSITVAAPVSTWTASARCSWTFLP